jgi:hypothetical protein
LTIQQGALTFATGSTLQLSIANKNAAVAGAPDGNDFSQLSLSGVTTSLTNGNLNAIVTQPINQGDLFTVILNDGSASIAGQFANASFHISGDTYAYTAPGGQAFLVNYAYDASLGNGTSASGITPAAFESITHGDQVALLAIPEPTSGAALLAGLGSLLGLQRFRRRHSLSKNTQSA